MEFRQLLPEPATTAVADIVASLNLAGRAGNERPYTVANFISSVDGRAAFQDHSGPLGDRADRELFHGLRERVDAVFAGTTTLGMERYGRLVRDPDRRARRVAAGLAPEPLACVVTRSGNVPTEIPLFAEPEARIVVFTPTEPDLDGVAAQVEVVGLDRAELTLTMVMRLLRREYGISSLLCEGGPTVFSALIHERLADELFLTLAPKLTGGGMAPTISNGHELTELQQLEPVWAFEHGGTLYLRYALL